MTTLNSPFVSVPGLVFFTVSLFVLPGCKSWKIDDLPAEASVSEEVRAGRPFDPTTKSFGLSSRAQQIERNVGVE